MELDLTELERRFLEGSSNLDKTHVRIRQVIFAGTLFGVLLVIAAWLFRSLELVLGVALVYLVITCWEKAAYGRGVLVYKSLVQKLASRIEQLEGKAI